MTLLILSLFFVIEQMSLIFVVVFEEVRFLVYKESDLKQLLYHEYSLCLLTMYTSFTICAWSNL